MSVATITSTWRADVERREIHADQAEPMWQQEEECFEVDDMMKKINN